MLSVSKNVEIFPDWLIKTFFLKVHLEIFHMEKELENHFKDEKLMRKYKWISLKSGAVSEVLWENLNLM